MKIFLNTDIEYANIKAELLKDDNISKVIINKPEEKLIVTPNQNRNYNWMEDPLEAFKDKGKIKICNKIFNVIKYYENMGKVYELVLKEY